LKKKTPTKTKHQKIEGPLIDLLFALNKAADALQRSFHTEEMVFDAVREQIVSLGLRGGLSSLDGEGNHLVIRVIAYPAPVMKILKNFEKLTGFKAEGFSIPIEEVDIYKQIIETGESVYVSDSSAVVEQLIPKPARELSKGIVKALGNTSVIYSPLTSKNQVNGVLYIVGRELTAKDIPIVEALSNHVAIALDNARLVTALRESEEKFKNAFDYAAIGRAIAIPEGQFLEVNSALCKMTGYTEEEFLSLTWQILTHPDYLEASYEQMTLLLEGKIPSFQLELKIKHKQRGYFWGYLNVVLVRDTKDKPLYMVGDIVDITERKQTEEKLFRLKELNEGIVQNVTEVIAMTDIEGNLTLLNPAVENLLKFSPHELIGKHWTTFVPSDQQPVVNAADERRARGHKDRYELELLTKDGERKTVVVSASPRFAGDRFVGTLAIFTDITLRKRTEEKLLYDAFHDALTGLPNRALFTDRLGRSMERVKRRQDQIYAVLFLDIDRFKIVNDSLGHIIGDQLLIAIAQRLEGIIRTVDSVARFAGDEFVILLESIGDIQDAIFVADRILEDLRLPFQLDQHEVFTSVSIGIVHSDIHYSQPGDILRDADIAMYRAKDLGRDRFEVFDLSMRDDAIARMRLEGELRQAIEREEFEVYYQPILNLEENRVISFEALLRWHHPERGLILPAEFLQVAEETGLIIPIGEWVLSKACRQMREWQIRYPISPPLTISVNLSSKQFTHPDLIMQIERNLEGTGLEANSLRLEITEGVIMENTVFSTDILKKLRALGVEVQMDDFGTGYSSLGVLHQFPLDTLKVDRTFISQMDTGEEKIAFVRTIVNLAHDLGMDVIAEGVETAEQADLLKALRCKYAQGNYFSKSVDNEAAERLMRETDTKKT